jgi:tetratricopeptide (TPR) repeat protein
MQITKHCIFIGLILLLMGIGCQRRDETASEGYQPPDSAMVKASMLMNKGVEYYNAGHYLKSVEMYQQALYVYGDFPEAHYNMGLSYRKLNQIDGAIEAYGKALALKRDYPQALNNLAFIYLQYKPDLNQALPLAQKAVGLKPLNPDFLDTYARILFGLGEVDSAIVVLEKAIYLSEDPAELQQRLELFKSVQK